MARAYGAVKTPSSSLLQPAEATLLEWAKARYASSTLRNRSSLWARLVTHMGGVLPTPADAVFFLAGMADAVKSSTLRGYAGSLNAVGRSLSLSWDPQPLQDLAALVKGLPCEPANQAVPATKSQIWEAFHFLKGQGEFQAAYILLFCWKGAARLGDILCLRGSDVYPLPDQPEGPSLLVDWRRTKGRTADPHTDTRFAMLGGAGIEELCSFLNARGAFRRSNRNWPVFSLSPRTVISALRSCPGCSALSGHSMKRGALQFLLSVAFRGVSVTPDDLRRFARHRGPVELLPGVTLRYLADARIVLAEFLSLRRLSVVL